MPWQLVDAPSHIAPEVGANLLTGAGPWTAPLALDGEYVLTVEVLGGGVVEWSVAGVDGEGLPVTVPGLSETVPDGEWVRVTIPFTAPGFVGDATVALTVPGESRDPVLGALTGRTVLTVPGDVLAETIMASGGIVAGTPGGARVELTDEGLVAFDASGTETAHIRGKEGVFVGGEFRTSDTLPGQVTLSDTANVGTPGLSVEPEDSTGYDVLPSIGPGPTEMHISGGVSTAGDISGAQFGAAGTSIYHNGHGANGAGSWVLVNGDEARLAYREDRANVSRESGMRVRPASAVLFTEGEDGYGHISASSTAASLSVHSIAGNASSDVASVRANLEDAMLSMRKQGGRTRRLRVDEGGVWAEIETGPNSWLYDSYNLLETAQDSGWQSITPDAGYTGSASFAWRNKGGVIWYRGTVTATWTAGWNTIATLPAEVHPEYAYTVNEAGTSAGVLIRTQVDGRLELYAPTAGTSTHRFTSLSYPVG